MRRVAILILELFTFLCFLLPPFLVSLISPIANAVCCITCRTFFLIE